MCQKLVKNLICLGTLQSLRGGGFRAYGYIEIVDCVASQGGDLLALLEIIEDILQLLLTVGSVLLHVVVPHVLQLTALARLIDTCSSHL